MGMAIKQGNEMDYPLHTSTFKPIVDFIARLKLLLTVGSYICSPPPKMVQDVPSETLNRKNIYTEGRVAKKA